MEQNFRDVVLKLDPGFLRVGELGTLQVNLGNLCNQRCSHCHINAGPDGKNIMPRSVMENITSFLKGNSGLIVDVTGGCPEMNPDFRFFIDSVYPYASKVMIRTNLTVFFEPGLDWVPQWYRKHKVTIIASLPCYTEGNVDSQRGGGVFNKSIEAIKMLNGLGYGSGNLELDLVYNPGGGFLAGDQEQLENDYKQHLWDEHGIVFNKLFTITNAPIGRFKQYLEANGGLEDYMDLLVENFNPAAAGNIMCRSLVSVSYRGIVYNCDFNQALDLPMVGADGEIVTIDTLEAAMSGDMGIITGRHCFCCTAGAGSSCTGAISKR
ncbi:MAG: arsenosugar biosynthesis radical SAM protein ArsS [Gammaproteobacteria bacterium]|nr:arsenosugar biosynthesis radical SAM protein ArsS [Gammaproteobacteria bacterium]